MRAAVATGYDADDPLSVLGLADVPDAADREGWVRVHVRAASLNHHDLWTLRGMTRVDLPLPLVLGTDAAGVTDDGREVVVHAVLGPGSLLSETAPGTLAESMFAPVANLVDKPAELSFVEAACLPTSYLTAYNMLFGKGAVRPGEHVLVQGAGGGVASALIMLARAAGLEVTVATRSPERGERARALGAHHVVRSGERLTARVDAVMETVGRATWTHSLRSVRPGGRIVLAGATSGFDPSAELHALFLRDVDVRGTYMGSRDQLVLLTRFLVAAGVRPLVDSVFGLDDAVAAMTHLAGGEAFGKVVVSVDG